jgi:hypothetical protein
VQWHCNAVLPPSFGAARHKAWRCADVLCKARCAAAAWFCPQCMARAKPAKMPTDEAGTPWHACCTPCAHRIERLIPRVDVVAVRAHIEVAGQAADTQLRVVHKAQHLLPVAEGAHVGVAAFGQRHEAQRQRVEAAVDLVDHLRVIGREGRGRSSALEMHRSEWTCVRRGSKRASGKQAHM